MTLNSLHAQRVTTSSCHSGSPHDVVQLSCSYSSFLQFAVLTSTVLCSLQFVEKLSVTLALHVFSRVLISTSVNGVLTVGSTDEAMQDVYFNSSVRSLLPCLAHVNVCLLSLPVHLPYSSCPPSSISCMALCQVLQCYSCHTARSP